MVSGKKIAGIALACLLAGNFSARAEETHSLLSPELQQAKDLAESDRKVLEQMRSELRAKRKVQNDQSASLRQQRHEALKAGKKKEAKALLDQITQARKQNQQDLKPTQEKIKAQEKKYHADQTVFRMQAMAGIKNLKHSQSPENPN